MNDAPWRNKREILELERLIIPRNRFYFFTKKCLCEDLFYLLLLNNKLIYLLVEVVGAVDLWKRGLKSEMTGRSEVDAFFARV
jgi:hypothetical protein